MIFNKVETIERYQQIIERYYSKNGVSNDYLQRDAKTLIKKGELLECCEENNAYLLVKKTVGHRMYYYINDFNTIPNCSNIKDVVVEILYRGEPFYPQQEIGFLKNAGFKVNLTRDLYTGIYKDLVPPILNKNIEVRYTTTMEEVEFACNLFNISFDTLSGDYISQEEYSTLFQNKSILIATDRNQNLLGALHQSFTGKVACISHIVVLPEARGYHVGQSLLNRFVENHMETEKSRYMFWVQQQNTAAVSMYQKKGFKYAGKSTISLIK